jgi:hypothetical protein
MLHEKELPKKLWAEAANTSVYLLNRMPTRALQKKTPFEAWFGYKPDLQQLKIFGCICFTHVPQVKRDKLDKKSEPGVFIGYSSPSKAYRIFQPQNGRILVSRESTLWKISNGSGSNQKKSWNHQQRSKNLQSWRLLMTALTMNQ